jgi:integrase/recombinase XerD
MLLTFDQFVKERRYIMNVSEATVRWYWCSWKAWKKYQPDFIINARQAGVSAATLNCYLRALNGYFRWAGLPVLPKLKQAEKVIATYGESDIEKIVKAKCKGRAQTLCLLLVDTGMRIDETLSIEVSKIDFDNLLIRVMGKGSKERFIPFSFEMRKVLFRYKGDKTGLLFSTRDGRKLKHRNVLRDVKEFLVRIGAKPPERLLHAFRHTFALNYLRRGGSVFHLQKILGHSTLDMTRRYCALTTDDLVQAHQGLSLLSVKR